MIRIDRSLLEQTFAILRKCGGARAECQVLWAAELDRRDRIVEVLHPRHCSGEQGFELDDHWISNLWVSLARTRRCLSAQVHTHPRRASHSKTDDDFPIIHTEGFLSLVIPNFATGPVGLRGAYTTKIGPDGQWRAQPPPALIEVT